MFRSKVVKGFVMGLGLAMTLSTAAFAEKVPDEEKKIQIINIGEAVEALAPDAAVSSDGQVILPEPRNSAAVSELAGGGTDGSSGSIDPAMAADAVSKEMYDRQLEADRYLFADHIEEISAKGIAITHTLATNEYVEIGITPFNEENAEFIYQALGRDQIKVVEGIQAISMDIGLAADGSEVLEAQLYSPEADAVSATVESVNATTLMAAIAAVVVLLGGTLLVTRRMKAAKGN